MPEQPKPLKPLPPLANTKKARVDALYAHYLNLTVDMPAHKAVQAVLDEAIPDDQPGQILMTPGQKIVTGFLVTLIVLVLLPPLIWLVGRGLLPLWIWGLSAWM